MRPYWGVLRTVLARGKDGVSQPDESAINLLIDATSFSEGNSASMPIYEIPLTIGDSPRLLVGSFYFLQVKENLKPL
jgi:hypothetical protein